MTGTDDLPLSLVWFETAMPKGPALGEPETMKWGDFISIFSWRREGSKDGSCFCPARFTLEPDERHVRRIKANLLARTILVLDIETSKATGEIPPPPAEACEILRGMGWAGLVYTSHSHLPTEPRYRVVLPISAAIEPDLPAIEIVAAWMGLAGVVDASKIGASSLFYLPSRPVGADPEAHETTVVPGAPVDSEWLIDVGGRRLEEHQAEADRLAAGARAAAEARRAVKAAAGFDLDDSMIEKIRSRLDLPGILTSHGYARQGEKYRHPNSSSGMFGADIKVLGGVERVFSHNATDPLHGGNLPAWCGVTALDAFDVAVILDFGGDRNKALRELAERFNLTKAAERKSLAGVLFRLIRQQANQRDIEAAASAEGERLGLARDEICRVAAWVACLAKPAA